MPVGLVSDAAEFISTLIKHVQYSSRTCIMVLELLGSKMRGLRSVNAALCDNRILRMASEFSECYLIPETLFFTVVHIGVRKQLLKLQSFLVGVCHLMLNCIFLFFFFFLYVSVSLSIHTRVIFI